MSRMQGNPETDVTSDDDHCQRIELKGISTAAKRIGNLMDKLVDNRDPFMCLEAASPSISSPSLRVDSSIAPHLITPSRSFVNDYVLNSPLIEPDSDVMALKN